jgi:hypothetical protein
MLNRLSDFYRIVNPDPSDTLIIKRKEAIAAFIDELSTHEVQFACVEIAAFGLGPAPSAPQVTVAEKIVTAIQGSQPSFVSDIGANAIDLRVFSAVALGEYIDKQDDPITAAMVISALATRPLPEERYLSDLISALYSTARRAATARGDAERERPELELPTVQGADAPSISRSLNEAMQQFTQAVERNLRVDREELDILWWIFGGHSKIMGKPFQSIELPQRILVCGRELADFTILPPSKASVQFLHAVLKDAPPLTLRQLIEPCPSRVLESIASREADLGAVLKHPALLPLTWLSRRRVDSGMTAGWESEFEQKTHIAVGDERPSVTWAEQVFNECVAVMLIKASAEQNQG